MSETSASEDGRIEAAVIRASGRCRGKIALGLAILAIVRAAQTWAGEQPTFAIGPVKPDFNPTRSTLPLPPLLTPFPQNFQPTPESFQTVIDAEPKVFSNTEFRPRGHSVLDKSSAESTTDAPMMKGTNAWQRLADYRSHNRVRLLTLWEGGGSSVSLQAGKGGNPSVQWTSRSMNRGGATRGLFDELFSISLSSAGHGFKPAPRAQASEISAKPIKSEAAELK